MNENLTTERIEARAVSQANARWLSAVWLILPLSLFAVAIWWLVAADPLARFDNGAPPVENLTVERTILDHDGLRLLVRAGGSEPMTIAQVQVDAAYWEFVQEPGGTIARGDTAWIRIPFPWVAGEAHLVNFVTNTGATFEHPIPVAVATPDVTSANLASQAILGAFVGILPVVVGLMFYPALRGAGPSMMDFLLAMTIGLLGFLVVDTVEDALEFASEAAAIFQGQAMVVLAAAASFLLLMAVSRRRGPPAGVALATSIALGIGLHNLGEGLAIGAAFAAGAAGLGTFLVIGFTLHNITEGIGIAAPILKTKPPLLTFAGLALLAGGPAVIGMWIGSLAFAPHWSALALAVGAGAILQVIVDVGALLMRNRGRGAFATAPVLAGLAVGVAVMYATAMLVKV
jgi:zinc transporter, ZIP family